MTMRFHYRTITSYRELPPKWRIVSDEDTRSPVDQYLGRMDENLEEARLRIPYAGGDDLVSLVFANQALTHESQSRQLAELIQERRALNEKHLRDIQWRLDELLERKPLRLRGPAFVDNLEVYDVEKEILDLERQKRALDVALWRDIQELRVAVADERREQHATRRRIDFLAGGEYARN